MKTVTPKDIEVANACGAIYLRENCGAAPCYFTFDTASHGGARCGLVDEEGTLFLEVGAEAVNPAGLVALNLIYAQGMRHGQISGEFDARRKMLEALGISGVVAQAEADQRAAREAE
jgi:hypothetical protein